MNPILAYLGPEGSFSAQASRQYADRATTSLELRPYPTITAIFAAIAEQEANFALVPAENSIEGSVNLTMDLLVQDSTLYIRGEMILPIRHHLLSRASDLSQITQVYSHPQALAQCRSFLSTYLKHATQIAANSTAEAARLIAHGEPNQAAISSEDCAAYYQLPLIATEIADYANNETRFLLIGREPLSCTNHKADHNTAYKTSLILDLKKDHPGGLYQVLGLFAQENINLTRIESRPSKAALGKYLFFIDCEGSTAHPSLQRVLENLSSVTASYRNLGSYNFLPLP